MESKSTSISPPKLLLSPNDAAQALSMSKSKLYGLWRNDPKNAPPFLTIGKNRYVAVETLKRWLVGLERTAAPA